MLKSPVQYTAYVRCLDIRQQIHKKLIHKVKYRLFRFIILDLGGMQDQVEPVKIKNST